MRCNIPNQTDGSKANLFIFYKSLCSFFTNPYARVLSASGVVTRFKKRLSIEAVKQQNSPILNY